MRALVLRMSDPTLTAQPVSGHLGETYCIPPKEGHENSTKTYKRIHPSQPSSYLLMMMPKSPPIADLTVVAQRTTT